MKVNQKNLILKKYKSIIQDNKYVIISHNHKISNPDWISIKSKFRNIKFKSIHNKLFANALNNTGYKKLSSFMVGPNILIYTNEEGLKEIQQVIENQKDIITPMYVLIEDSIFQKNEFLFWLKLKDLGYDHTSIIKQLKINQFIIYNVLSLYLKYFSLHFKN